MFKGVKTTGLVFFSAALLSLFSLSCSENDGPTQSTAVNGALDVFFDPNPAPITDYGQYTSFLCVGVPGGAGVYIHGTVRQQYSASGEPTVPETHDENWFKTRFQADPAQGAYIPAGEARCALFDWKDYDHDRFEDWTFFGEDDFGNAVSGTGRLYLGAVH